MKKRVGIIIRADKTVSFRTVESLRDMQMIVGGLIEPITLSEGSSMYVNEEGIIHGLPFNSIASDLLIMHARGTWHSAVGLPEVLGDVIVVGPLDGDGNDTHVTPQVHKQVRKIGVEADAHFIGDFTYPTEEVI